MRRVAILGLGLLVACNSGTPEEVEDLPATLVIAYSWAGYDNLPEQTCAAAWADTVYVEMDHPDGAYNLRSAACDNTEIEIPALATGDWTLQVRTTQFLDTAPSSYGASDIIDVTLRSDEVLELDVELHCVENGNTCDRAE